MESRKEGETIIKHELPIYIYVCIHVNAYRMERGAVSAIITENNEQQAKSVGWGQTNWNAMGSQRKEGKHAQRKHPQNPSQPNGESGQQ